MNLEIRSLFLNQDFLSNTELFFSSSIDLEENKIIISDEEFHHLAKVMRKKEGDKIFVTDGKGAIYESKISTLNKRKAALNILNSIKYTDKLRNISFYIPNLHNKERMRFAVEKLIELGFTKIRIYNSSRTVAKGFNHAKWEKVAVAAIKQSLRAFLPEISFCENLMKSEINNLIFFDQNGTDKLIDARGKINFNDNISVLIGPEGGLSEEEIQHLKPKYLFKLNDYRLRSETAVIVAASMISSLV